ncbi:type IV pilus secretin PilQ [Candidatus Magnetominusculus xianensis]|uniref:Type II/III secretion system protein n=1 Tax=Candidatus Magnetominusculus xianensis TaxID=1748249 RepID=A0ABR5SCI0_9BACT|nr:type IV pilus secretin PilQ [Candidatus Magnetominusculus xianensis]KWT75618.1 type II/III secretion system protein [Candidatus Magnetominusculus xianensis]MBF0403701.1 type IV pilus secretin PilQ [Nitrospirota bacterium]
MDNDKLRLCPVLEGLEGLNVFKLSKVMILLLVFAVFGCQTEVKRDAEMEKWSKLADSSRGYTPSKKPSYTKETTATAIVKDKDAPGIGEPSKPMRELPSTPINLKVRKAELRAVLRAIASSEGINLLVKDNVVGTITVDFSNTRWDKVFKSILRSYGLAYIWEDNIIRVMKQEDIEQEEKNKAAAQEVRLVDPLESYVVKLNYTSAKNVRENLVELLTKDKTLKSRGAVKVDEHTNSLIIDAIHDDMEKIMRTIEVIDKPTPQIWIKANIVETSKEVARNLGIQWGGMYSKQVSRGNSMYITPGGTTGTATAFTTNPTNVGVYQPAFSNPGIGMHGYGVDFPVSEAVRAAAGGIGSLGFAYGILGGDLLEMQLQALQKDSKLNIISSPSITTLDNLKAYTESGEKVPYVSTSTSGGAMTSNVNFIDAVLRLEITPHVIDNDTMKLIILVKKDEVDSTRSVQGNPYIVKKETSTTLIVQDGETIVISGLTKEKRQKSDTGIPGLKDIPLLGYLFKSDNLDNNYEEVLIFITPHILPARPMDMAANSQNYDSNAARAKE